ncbi:uncharacterized protein LOC135156785 [Lytechinus pictus]|uniref:uncharacterized protein LOC135156785 n=1 Tax=Lytechinus pictus TaxID=7653 RepID=UPI0030B9CD27
MSHPAKKRVLQKYRKEYSEKFPVLTTSKLGEHFTYCTLCSVDVNVGHGGISDIQRHIDSKKHRTNAEATKGKPLTSYFTTTSDVSVINAEVSFTEFIIEHSIPLSVADHCGKLFKKMFPDSQIAQKYACGRTKTSYIVDTLGKDSQKRILNSIRESPFSMATDGSTDYEDVKLYPVCVRYFDPKEGQVMSVLLSLTECAKPSTGENIFLLLQNEMDKFEIPWKNLVCFSADNASVMLGKVKGVSAFLQKKTPSLYVAGCPCHLMHIAAERASKHLPVKIDDLLIDIFYHLEKSSKRKQSFKAHQEKTGAPPHKILKHVSTRWLSLGHCIARLLEQWDALLSFFTEEVAKEKTTNKKHVEQGSSLSKPASLTPMSDTTAVKQKSAVLPCTKRPMTEGGNPAKNKKQKSLSCLPGSKKPVTSSAKPSKKKDIATSQCQDTSSSQKATNKEHAELGFSLSKAPP